MTDRRSELVEQLVRRRRRFHEQDFPAMSRFAGTDIEQEVAHFRRRLENSSLEQLEAQAADLTVKDAVLNCFPE